MPVLSETRSTCGAGFASSSNFRAAVAFGVGAGFGCEQPQPTKTRASKATAKDFRMIYTLAKLSTRPGTQDLADSRHSGHLSPPAARYGFDQVALQDADTDLQCGITLFGSVCQELSYPTDQSQRHASLTMSELAAGQPMNVKLRKSEKNNARDAVLFFLKVHAEGVGHHWLIYVDI
jgi:hypothetical protein